jgi:hypothetical protein
MVVQRSQESRRRLFLGSTIEVLGRAGWTYDDPAQIYAADAATVAEQL